jgi:hypothetical protein
MRRPNPTLPHEPIVIFDRSGYADIIPTLDVLAEYLEDVDVAREEYVAYDANGHVIHLSVSAAGATWSLDSPPRRNLPDFRARLLDHFRKHGSAVSLAELAAARNDDQFVKLAVEKLQ